MIRKGERCGDVIDLRIKKSPIHTRTGVIDTQDYTDNTHDTLSTQHRRRNNQSLLHSSIHPFIHSSNQNPLLGFYCAFPFLSTCRSTFCSNPSKRCVSNSQCSVLTATQRSAHALRQQLKIPHTQAETKEHHAI